MVMISNLLSTVGAGILPRQDPLPVCRYNAAAHILNPLSALSAEKAAAAYGGEWGS